MMWSKVERLMELSRLTGIRVTADEADEVADRLYALTRELESLGSLDLADIQPIVVFPDEPDDGG
jgi:hypothetical protein